MRDLDPRYKVSRGRLGGILLWLFWWLSFAFFSQNAQQLKALKDHLDEEVGHHEKIIKEHQVSNQANSLLYDQRHKILFQYHNISDKYQYWSHAATSEIVIKLRYWSHIATSQIVIKLRYSWSHTATSQIFIKLRYRSHTATSQIVIKMRYWLGTTASQSNRRTESSILPGLIHLIG